MNLCLHHDVGPQIAVLQSDRSGRAIHQMARPPVVLEPGFLEAGGQALAFETIDAALGSPQDAEARP